MCAEYSGNITVISIVGGRLSCEIIPPVADPPLVTIRLTKNNNDIKVEMAARGTGKIVSFNINYTLNPTIVNVSNIPPGMEISQDKNFSDPSIKVRILYNSPFTVDTVLPYDTYTIILYSTNCSSLTSGRPSAKAIFLIWIMNHLQML